MSTNEYANTTECQNTRLSHSVMEEEEGGGGGGRRIGDRRALHLRRVKLKEAAALKTPSAEAISLHEDFPTTGKAARTRGCVILLLRRIVPLSSS